MRPSARLLALILILTALTVLVAIWLPFMDWLLIYVWIVLIGLVLADLLLAWRSRRMTVALQVPAQGFVGHDATLVLEIKTASASLARAIDARLDLDQAIAPPGSGVIPLTVAADRQSAGAAIALPLQRRGQFSIRRLWLKWASPLQLLDIIRSFAVAEEIAILPDISPVLSGAIQAQILPLQNGQKDMRMRGEGSEFHQLREFSSGMDPRAIDWKRSARIGNLVVRETRAEKNHQIILCIDSGRLMAEQLAGQSKLDRAINASLALCWAAGLAGDAVGLYNFDARPRLFVPALPGRSAFPRLQTICASLRYETQETNHTLGLTHLSGRLKRRSLIIIFSDFVDSTTAELMVENVGVLARHHFVVYVALRDPILRDLMAPNQFDPDTISRSVAARQIMQERRSVMDRLNRLGVLCLDCSPDALSTELISRYIEIKSREMI